MDCRRARSRTCWGIGPLAVAALCAVILGGCSRPPRDDAKPVLRLYCGAGIRPPVAELVEEFGADHAARIECDYAGSNVLLSRIKLVRRGDLYMPGDVRYVEQAAAEGLVESSQTACYLVPVILVRKGNPKDITSVPDLRRPGLQLGVGDPQACAIGKVTQQIISKHGLRPEELGENIEFHALTVDELGLQIKAGKLDAAIVWDATARNYPDSAQIVSIPPEHNVISTVPVAVLTCSDNPQLAHSFQEFVVSDHGAEVFQRHGYSTTPPAQASDPS